MKIIIAFTLAISPGIFFNIFIILYVIKTLKNIHTVFSLPVFWTTIIRETKFPTCFKSFLYGWCFFTE